MQKKMRLSTKLVVSFLAVGIVPFAVVSAVSLQKASRALSDLAYNQLYGVQQIKKTQIEKFFEERRGDLGVLTDTVASYRAKAFEQLEAVQELKRAQLEEYFATVGTQLKNLKDDPFTMEALTQFDRAFEAAGDKVLTPEWLALAETYDRRLADIAADNGWGDLFLIHHDGDIVYTVARESDLGQTIPDSALKTSPLGVAFQKAQSLGPEELAVADFGPYAPSGGKQAAFMMAQMRDQTGKLVGYVAFEIPIDPINAIVQRRHGMGRTGETYLVGKSDGKTAFRSDMVTMGDGKYVVGYPITTTYIQEALAGKEVHDVFTDSSGALVAVAADPLEIEGLHWAAVSKIDLEEVIAPHAKGKTKDFFARYIEQYGYYDLFLIHPEGHIFYTVCKESDYDTNILSGPYAGSGLGTVVAEVLRTRGYGMADFEPYAPSNGEPASFIAQPVIHEGDVELVVALQLSLDALNAIMQQREGLGETGETYLVGPDKLMRSDSYLDPTNHSVKASFANPARGKVDTRASREALAGREGHEIIIDYNGHPVLSAYAPLNLSGTTWALIAEIDESEAFAAVNSLKWLVGIVGTVGAGGILVTALLLARSISRPLNRIIDGLSTGSEQVTSASDQVSSASQSLAEGASEQAASIEETSSSLEELSSMTQQNADNARQADGLMGETKQVVDKANRSMTELTASIGEISASSEETAKIIKTIDEIAFQTNLLALNAAVEAARAGEAGAGFAVVADEVRNLAMRAAEAAKNTSEIIEDTIKKVQAGDGLVKGTNEAFGEVAASARRVAELVGEIAAASQEQSSGIEQINKAVAEMDKVVQTNAANAEESASASEELSAQAQQMQTMVEDLMALVGGAGNGSSGSGLPRLRRPKKAVGRAPSVSKPALKAPASVRPEQVIPLDEGEFEDF